MDTLQFLLAALRAAPSDELAWLAVADCLEETGQSARAELVRLTRRLLPLPHGHVERPLLEERLRALLAEGVRPCLPEQMVGKMRFVLIPPGAFSMGSPTTEPGRYEDEELHEVRITRPFWMLSTAVTQAHYEAVIGKKQDWTYPGAELPAHGINYDDAKRFCERLGKKERRVCRLPSEAEWEYACRAGTTTIYHLGDEIARVVFGRHADEGPDAVASHPPNAFGLHDMHGNVWEWCNDWFDARYFADSPREDPPGPETGTVHVIRGGSWSSTEGFCRSACREYASHESNRPRDGFRVVMEE